MLKDKLNIVLPIYCFDISFSQKLFETLIQTLYLQFISFLCVLCFFLIFCKFNSVTKNTIPQIYTKIKQAIYATVQNLYIASVMTNLVTWEMTKLWAASINNKYLNVMTLVNKISKQNKYCISISLSLLCSVF